MSNLALGMVEARGYTTAVTVADAMVKTANVEIIARHSVGSALICVIITGDVGAVKAATEAGAEAGNLVGEVVAVHVIPRPHPDLAKHFDVVKTGK